MKPTTKKPNGLMDFDLGSRLESTKHKEGYEAFREIAHLDLDGLV